MKLICSLVVILAGCCSTSLDRYPLKKNYNLDLHSKTISSIDSGSIPYIVEFHLHKDMMSRLHLDASPEVYSLTIKAETKTEAWKKANSISFLLFRDEIAWLDIKIRN